MLRLLHITGFGKWQEAVSRKAIVLRAVGTLFFSMWAIMAISLLFCTVAKGQSIRYSGFYDYDNGAGGFLNIIETDNRFIAQGTNSKDGVRQSHTVNIDFEGNLLDDYSVFDVNVGYESFAMIKLDNGNIVSAGSLCDYNEPSPGYCDFYFARHNETGDTLFTKAFERKDTSDLVLDMVQTRPNKIMLIGWTYDDTTNTDADLLFITVDTLGNEVNRVVFGGGGTDYVNAGLTVDSLGSVIMVGYTKSFPSINSGRSWVLKTDSIGNVLWHRTYSGIGASTANGIRADLLPDKNIIISGGKSGNGYLQKIDTAGNEIWIKEYNVVGAQGLWGVVGLEDGTIVSCGVTDDGNGGSQAGWLIKTDENGDTLWTRTYNPSSSVDYLRNMLVMPNGDIVMVGFGRGENSTTQDGWILRVDSMGCLQEGCFSVGIEDRTEDDTRFAIWPNPVADVLNVELVDPSRSTSSGQVASLWVTVFDMSGKEILRFAQNDKRESIDVSAWPAGIYMLNGLDEKGSSFSVKVVKQ